jgi:peroxiredoxin Q/BCP
VPRLNTGDAAPAFQVADPDGRPVRSEDLRGTRTVLYFFPKANTAG